MLRLHRDEVLALGLVEMRRAFDGGFFFFYLSFLFVSLFYFFSLSFLNKMVNYI